MILLMQLKKQGSSIIQLKSFYYTIILIFILKMIRYSMKIQVFLLKKLIKESRISSLCDSLIEVRHSGLVSLDWRTLRNELLQTY